MLLWWTGHQRVVRNWACVFLFPNPNHTNVFGLTKWGKTSLLHIINIVLSNGVRVGHVQVTSVGHGGCWEYLGLGQCELFIASKYITIRDKYNCTEYTSVFTCSILWEMFINAGHQTVSVFSDSLLSVLISAMTVSYSGGGSLIMENIIVCPSVTHAIFQPHLMCDQSPDLDMMEGEGWFLLERYCVFLGVYKTLYKG